jgi:excisionase family DNA binding protein
MKERRIVKTSELAKYLQLDEITIRKWTCQKRVPHYKIGKSVRFDLDSIDKWLEEQHQEPYKYAA